MIVLSVGGSIVNPGEPNKRFIKDLAELLLRTHKRNPVAVLVGGGAPARAYAKAIAELGGSEFLADNAAIFSTRQNSLLLMAALGKNAWPSVPADFEEAAVGATSGRILVMGGTIPGITTDTDAALLAEMLGAERIVNVSKVDGVYSADPNRDSSAKKYERMTFQQLVSLASKSDRRVAGENFVFDVIACKIIARSKIEVHFVGPKMQDIEAAILGKKHSGTMVRD